MNTELIAAISSALDSSRLIGYLKILCRAMSSKSGTLFAALSVIDKSRGADPH